MPPLLRVASRVLSGSLSRPCPHGGDSSASAWGVVMVRWPVSGILWVTAEAATRWPSICAAYPRDVRGLTVTNERAVRSLCSALLRMGFTEPMPSPTSLVRSYRTVSPSPVIESPCGDPVHRRSALCCTFTVRSPRPGSRQHPALWSPDFPRRCSTQHRDHPATSPSAPSLRWTADLVNKLRK